MFYLFFENGNTFLEILREITEHSTNEYEHQDILTIPKMTMNYMEKCDLNSRRFFDHSAHESD